MISPEHRRAVEAVIPTGVKVPAEFWSDLNAILDVSAAMEKNRTTKPPAREMKKWQRIEESTAKLIAEMRDISGPPSWLDPPALSILKEIKRRAHNAVLGYEILAVGYHGHKRPHRNLIYDVICDLWLVHLKQEDLPFSMTDGEPCGPTVRFFEACLTPALGGEFSPYMVRAAIGRAKKRPRRPAGGMFFETEI